MAKFPPACCLLVIVIHQWLKSYSLFNEHVFLTGSDEVFLDNVKTDQAKRNKKNLSGTPMQQKTVTSSKRNPHNSQAEVSMPKSPLRVSQSQTPIVSGTPPLSNWVLLQLSAK